MGYRGITAKNEEQKHLCRALESNKPFTFVTGPAGTGKTLLSVAYGVDRDQNPVYGPRRVEYDELGSWIERSLNAADAVALEMTTNTWTMWSASAKRR